MAKRHQPSAVVLRRARRASARIITPTPRKPVISISHVPGSGTPDGGGPGSPEDVDVLVDVGSPVDVVVVVDVMGSPDVVDVVDVIGSPDVVDVVDVTGSPDVVDVVDVIGSPDVVDVDVLAEVPVEVDPVDVDVLADDDAELGGTGVPDPLGTGETPPPEALLLDPVLPVGAAGPLRGITFCASCGPAEGTFGATGSAVGRALGAEGRTNPVLITGIPVFDRRGVPVGLLAKLRGVPLVGTLVTIGNGGAGVNAASAVGGVAGIVTTISRFERAKAPAKIIEPQKSATWRKGVNPLPTMDGFSFAMPS